MSLRKLIKETLINEVFNKPIRTKYEIDVRNNEINYIFKLSSRNKYFVRFTTDNLIPSETLINYDGNRKFYYLTIVGFSNIENYNTDSDIEFSTNTNHNEQIELIGSVMFIIEEYEKKWMIKVSLLKLMI